MHMSLPKPNTRSYRNLVREAVPRDSGLVACAIPQPEVGEWVTAGDIWEAWRRAMQLSCVKNERANLAHERNQEKHWLKPVGILKRATDTEDIFFNL